MSAVSTLQAAIIQLEGSNPAYNNPGDITDEFEGATGSYFGTSVPIPIYSTPAAGLAALEQKLSNIYNGNSSVYNTNMTLDQFGTVYGGSSTYGASLANILGVPSSTPLSQIPSGVSGASTSAPGSLSSIYNGITSLGSNAASAASSAASVGSFLKGLTKRSLEDYTVIIVGILLIGAGLFSFKSTQTIITTTGRVIGRTARAASEAAA